MIDETVNVRKERIERLLEQLRYEVERGMMDGEIGESMGFVFFVPISKELKGGVVRCEFRTRPTPAYQYGPFNPPHLEIIKGGRG